MIHPESADLVECKSRIELSDHTGVQVCDFNTLGVPLRWLSG